MRYSIKTIAIGAGSTIAIVSIAQASSPEEIEELARAFAAPKYEIEKIEVVADWTGNTNRIDGYSARVTPKICSGSLDLYFDDAGFLKSSNDNVKC